MNQRIVLISISALLTVAGIAIIRVKTNDLPDMEIDLARKMISEAELSGSSEYANEHFLEAAKYYDSAMIEWSRENERFILFRNYRGVVDLAMQSTESSGNAIAIAKENIVKAGEVLEIRIHELGDRMKDFDDTFGSFPMNNWHRNEIAESKLQYSEGVLAYKNKNYTLCSSRLDSVESTLNRVLVFYEEKLYSYLGDYPKWSGMVDKTILFSKRNKAYCIIVDKLAKECMLYKDGKLMNRYTVELGVNWMGHKNQQGDKSTPEGLYKITDKKTRGQTAFYKAMMLDYPNDADKRRFLQNKKSGAIHRDANIGGLIEIHGNGGKGIDWTDGCIALKDGDLDEVFKLCPVGTWVTIVGSTRSFNDLFTKQE